MESTPSNILHELPAYSFLMRPDIDMNQEELRTHCTKHRGLLWVQDIILIPNGCLGAMAKPEEASPWMTPQSSVIH